MKKVINYVPIHFVVCVILGIVLQFYTKFWEFGFLNFLFLFVSIFILLLIVHHKIIRTLVSFLMFFAFGISAVFFTNDKNYYNYYNNNVVDSSTAVLKVTKVLKSSTYHHKYEAEVIQIDAARTRGKILLNLTKDSVSEPLKVDELILAQPDFMAIPNPLNPHQFNYKSYLEKQGIYNQIYLDKNAYKRLGIQHYSLQGLSEKFRNKVQESLTRHYFKQDELTVINALLLGQKQEISKELSNNYAKAGAIHILAVSGLHVGIILWILTWLLQPLERLPKGKIIKTFCIVLLLWMFAFIAGLSASVTRAVTMFTFLAVGLSFQRKNIVLFSLISSMFFLLIVKPMFLFDVGFQLSYLAVFGIVFLQPKLFKLYNPKFCLDKKIWEITSVSIAAQIGVLPLSLYYFHQFPGLFMLSNLVIIPFLGAILVGGIVIIFLALVGILPQFMASIFGKIIAIMNAFVSWVSHQEEFLFQGISFSMSRLIVTYIIIISAYRFFIRKTSKRLIYLLFAILIVQTVYLFENHKIRAKKEFIVFHKSRNSILGERVGKLLSIHHNLDSIEVETTNAISSYKIGENVKVNYNTNNATIFKFNHQHLLVIDSLGVYQVKNLKNPIVLLQQSPKINLERMIKTLSPKQIIADGSNYKTYVKSWQKTAKKQKTPFYYTGKNGAFIY